MSDTRIMLARVRSLALAAMATGEGKPLHVAVRSATPPPAAKPPRRLSPRPAGVAGVGLSPAELLLLAHVKPSLIAVMDRVVAKLGDGTAEARHAERPGQEQVHFRRRQKTLPTGWE